MREVLNEKTIVLNFFFNNKTDLNNFDGRYLKQFQINNLEFDPDEVILKHFCYQDSSDYSGLFDDCYMFSFTTDMINNINFFHSFIVNPNNSPDGGIYTGNMVPLQIPFPIKQPINGRTFTMEIKNYNGELIEIADINGLYLLASFTFTFIKYK